MKGLRLLLISLALVGGGCRTPATRTVIQRPFSEVKTEIVAFVKSHEEKPKSDVAPNLPPFFTFGTNAPDLTPFFKEWTNHTGVWVMTLDVPPTNNPPKPPEFRIIKIVDKEKPTFKIVFLWVERWNSFGHDQVEIEARPTSKSHTRLDIRALNSGAPNSSSSHFAFRDQYRETETLLRLCRAMHYRP